MILRRRFLSMLAAPALPMRAASSSFYVYFGTYTRQTSKGIYVSTFDAGKGALGEPQLAATVSNPSYLAVHPNGRLLYAVSEENQPESAVSSYSIDPKTGLLNMLNKVPAQGSAPCHLNLDSTGRSLVVANYSSGSVCAFPVAEDGTLREASAVIQHKGSSVNRQRQQGPHAHCVNLSKDNRFVIVSDLGLDEVLVYQLDPAQAKLFPHTPPFAKVKPGSGPRHFAFHPKSHFAYVINEIASTVIAFDWDSRAGTLAELQNISTLPDGFSGNNSTAEVFVHPSGRFLYGSNRGHNSIAVFAIDGKKGTLTRIENVSTKGQVPRGFAIDPTGRWLIAGNQNTDNVVLFAIDGKTGRLTPQPKTLTVGAPVCVLFVAQ